GEQSPRRRSARSQSSRGSPRVVATMTGASPEAGTGPIACYFEATFWLRPKTVSTPPCVLNLSASPKAPRAPRPAVGSSLLIPESTATYCLPSGPRYVIGLPMIPDGVLNRQSSLPEVASTAFSQPSMVP